MEQQDKLRRDAARAFMTSLEHLEQALEPGMADHEAESKPEIVENGSHDGTHYNHRSMDASIPLEMNMFEDAIADIEQFIKKMQSGQTQSGQS